MSELGRRILAAKRERANYASYGAVALARKETLYINWLVTRSPMADPYFR